MPLFRKKGGHQQNAGPPPVDGDLEWLLSSTEDLDLNLEAALAEGEEGGIGEDGGGRERDMHTAGGDDDGVAEQRLQSSASYAPAAAADDGSDAKEDALFIQGYLEAIWAQQQRQNLSTAVTSGAGEGLQPPAAPAPLVGQRLPLRPRPRASEGGTTGGGTKNGVGQKEIQRRYRERQRQKAAALELSVELLRAENARLRARAEAAEAALAAEERRRRGRASGRGVTLSEPPLAPSPPPPLSEQLSEQLLPVFPPPPPMTRASSSSS